MSYRKKAFVRCAAYNTARTRSLCNTKDVSGVAGKTPNDDIDDDDDDDIEDDDDDANEEIHGSIHPTKKRRRKQSSLKSCTPPSGLSVLTPTLLNDVADTLPKQKRLRLSECNKALIAGLLSTKLSSTSSDRHLSEFLDTFFKEGSPYREQRHLIDVSKLRLKFKN